MEKKKIRVLYLHHEDNAIMVEKCVIKDDLEVFYKMLKCRCIDIQVRYINGTPYNFIFDDEYLLTEDPKPTLCEKYFNEVICGNIIICPINKDNEEELGSFNDAELTRVICYLLRSHTYTFR